MTPTGSTLQDANEVIAVVGRLGQSRDLVRALLNSEAAALRTYLGTLTTCRPGHPERAKARREWDRLRGERVKECDRLEDVSAEAWRAMETLNLIDPSPEAMP